MDLDGTLSDNREGIIRSIAFAMSEMNLPIPPDQAILPLIGPPLRQIFTTLLPEGQRHRAEEGVTLYRERFSRTGWGENHLYDGIYGGLEQLRNAGFAPVIVTGKPREFARKIAGKFGIDRFLTGVYGTELNGRFDDKRELLAHVLRQENALAAHSVMIGDRREDMLAAVVNGVQGWGVTYGFGSAAELYEAGAATLFDTPDSWIKAVLQAGPTQN
ncbi:MAG TPA: HAD hydrolase-like protein [Calditrichia bacterium]|nr:HAD hydrolase-like protein [Calditrichia bacterium]HQV32361.1 HAD hydrolase-like protein [Calditrichia bacterium]